MLDNIKLSGTEKTIEKRAKIVLKRGWILDGAGPARYGYARLTPCREVFLGRTLADVAAALRLPRDAGEAKE